MLRKMCQSVSQDAKYLIHSIRISASATDDSARAVAQKRCEGAD